MTTITPTNRTRTRRQRLSANARRLLRDYDGLVECPKVEDAQVGPSRVAVLATAMAQLSKALHLETQGRAGDATATWQTILQAQVENTKVKIHDASAKMLQGVSGLAAFMLSPESREAEDADLLASLTHVHDAIRMLRTLETALAGDLGARVGKGKGDLPDGRQYELARTTDRKEWDHAEWKRDARRVLTTQLSERFLTAMEGELLIDTQTGEEVPLARVLQEAMAAIQNVQGSGPPKSTALKPLGLYASDYCTSTPGGWRFNAIAPTTTEETTTDD